MTTYQRNIKTLVDDDRIDPRHVEAFMRAEHGTLDSLPLSRFALAAHEAYMLVLTAGPAESERLANTYGL